jgi:hypothetical protein
MDTNKEKVMARPNYLFAKRQKELAKKKKKDEKKQRKLERQKNPAGEEADVSIQEDEQL